MTVKELAEKLKQCRDDSEVVIVEMIAITVERIESLTRQTNMWKK